MIDERDLRVDSYSVPAPNGKYDVRVTHLPTGIVETSSDKSEFHARKTAIKAIERRIAKAHSE